MKFIKFVEEKFWIPIIIFATAGILLPAPYTFLNHLIIPFIMVMFLLTCLKINFLDVISHIKNPVFIFYILFIYLLVIPTIIYILFHFLSPDLALGMLLLTTMPPGAVSPMLTDMFKGNISLSLTLVLVAYIISPFTIVLLFSLLTQKTIQLNLFSLFQTLLLVTYLPLALSLLIKVINKQIVEKTKQYYTFANIICICLITYIVLATQSKAILENPFKTLLDALWLYLLFFILYITSYFIARWRNKSEKIAIAVTKAYMNNGLALGIAVAFFSPQIILLIILSEIPWNTTVGFFKYLLKYLK